MARKDLLRSVLGAAPSAVSTEDRAGYAMRGASKQMKVSIDSLAEASRQIAEGAAIVEIEPDLIDASFVNDRLGEDDEAFATLRESIARGQQDTPVLLRPHPSHSGRYMTVFGHRRIRVARELGRKVRAVVKPLDDVAHVLAQGQENSARADLSFIEKALFARDLLALGQSKDVIQAALGTDATLLSRMLSVAQGVPRPVIEAIGPAKQIGRDRWEDLKKRVAVAEVAGAAETLARQPELLALESDARFELLHSRLAARGRAPARAPRPQAEKRTWTANGGRIKGVLARSGKAYTVSLTSKDSAAFGAYLAENLDRLYQSFLASKEESES